MKIGVFQIYIRIPMANSLKEKRSYLKGTIQRFSKKYNVSIAEVDHQDDWNNATLGVVCVSNEKKILENILRKILDDIETIDGLELESYDEEYL